MLSFESIAARPHYRLFKTCPNNHLAALFDASGFWLSAEAVIAHHATRHQPHLYCAWDENLAGIYIGKSFQLNGRWQRSNAHHLGKLANGFLPHWEERWFAGPAAFVNNQNQRPMASTVFITFIPYEELGPEHFSNWQMDFPERPFYNGGRRNQELTVDAWLKAVESVAIAHNNHLNLLNQNGLG